MKTLKSYLIITLIMISGGLSPEISGLKAQNIGVNTTGNSPAATNLFEVLQPSTTANTVGIHVTHSGAVSGTGYALEAIKNGASVTNIAAYLSASGATNNYALIVPSGGGNVGIGLTSPLQQLHINDNARATSFYVDGVTFMSTSAATGGDDIGFYTGSSTERMSITNTGNVGIGTTAPTEKLHVTGNLQVGDATITTAGIKLTRTNAGATATMHRFIHSNNAPTYQEIWGGTYTGENAGTVLSGTAAYLKGQGKSI